MGRYYWYVGCIGCWGNHHRVGMLYLFVLDIGLPHCTYLVYVPTCELICIKILTIVAHCLSVYILSFVHTILHVYRLGQHRIGRDVSHPSISHIAVVVVIVLVLVVITKMRISFIV